MAKNKDFRQKSTFWSNIKIVVKNQTFYLERRLFFLILFIRIFANKSLLWTKLILCTV